MKASLFDRAPLTWILVGVLCAGGCAGSQPASPPPNTAQPVQPAAAPGELRTRHPDEVRASDAAPSRPLGELEPVDAAKPLAEPGAPQPTAASARPLTPIHVAPDSAPQAYALRDGQLVLPSGLIIHNVPKSVAVRTVREQGGGELWEIVDARRRRLALIKVESLGRMPLPSSERLNELSSARTVGQRTDWGAPRVDVVSERFVNESYVYTIERRTKETAWIASGLDLSR